MNLADGLPVGFNGTFQDRHNASAVGGSFQLHVYYQLQNLDALTGFS